MKMPKKFDNLIVQVYIFNPMSFRHSQQMMLMLLVLKNCFSELGMLFCTWLMGALVFGTIMHYIEVKRA